MEDRNIEKSETRLPPAPMLHALFCYACGAALPEGNAFCGKCGQPRRSDEMLGRIMHALEKQEREEAKAMETRREGSPLATLREEGADAAIDAMTADYYAGNKPEISKDGAKILFEIFQPYIAAFTEISARSADGARVKALGKKLNELEGWLGMVKAHSYFKKDDPAHQQNLAELWVGIGEWLK